MNQKFLQWQEHIKEISHDVGDLVENRFIFYRLRDLLKPNIGITNNAFFDHYVINYVTTTVSSVRRQSDLRTSRGGLRKLFDEIISDPTMVTKEIYLTISEQLNPTLGRSVAEMQWKEKFGNLEYIDISIVNADIARLESVTGDIKLFVDKRVAHKDKEWADYELTYSQLDKAMDVLEELTIKYYQLFTCSGMPSLVPIFQYNWESIFREPWVK